MRLTRFQYGLLNQMEGLDYPNYLSVMQITLNLWQVTFYNCLHFYFSDFSSPVGFIPVSNLNGMQVNNACGDGAFICCFCVEHLKTENIQIQIYNHIQNSIRIYLFTNGRQLYFMSDPPHFMKTTNNIHSSGHKDFLPRLLILNGKEIKMGTFLSFSLLVGFTVRTVPLTKLSAESMKVQKTFKIRNSRFNI